MVTQVTSTVMGSNAISANNIADNAIVSRHIGDNVILARHVEDSVDPGIVQANLNATTANINTVTANVNSVAANVNTVQNNVAGILDGATFTGSILLGEGSSLGVSNVNPETSSLTLGSPANVIIQYGTSANPVGGNVIIGEGNGDIDGSVTPFRLDVRGTANVGALTATSLSGISTFVVADGGSIGSASSTSAITIAADGVVTFVDDIKIKNDGTIGSAGAPTAMTIASDGIVTFVDDIKIKDGGTIGTATTPTAFTIAADGDTAISGGLGIVGNTAPTATGLSIGTPANAILRTHEATGNANLIIGDATATSPYNLDVRGSANVGALTAVSLSGPTAIIVSDGGTVGSATTTDAITIASDGVVTFKDDIKIKDGGTIGSASDAAAITIAASGQVTFSDVATFSGGLKVPDDGDIGSASVTDAIQISSGGIVTFKDDIKIKDGGTIGTATTPTAFTIAADGDTAISGGLGVAGNTAPVAGEFSLGNPANVIIRAVSGKGGNVIIGDAEAISDKSLDVRGTANVGVLTASNVTLSDDNSVIVPNDGNIGSTGALDAMQISSGGIVTFKDDIKIKDDGTIGSASAPTAMTIDSSGIVTFVDDIKVKNDGTIGSAGSAGAITIASDGVVTFVDDIKVKDSGTIGSATTPGAITVAGDGAITIADDLTITGNLTVSGDTVSQEVTELTVEDRIILTAKNASGSPSLDTGLMVSRGSQGNVFIGYDESVNKVVLAHTNDPHTNTAISATSAANLDALAITASNVTLSHDNSVIIPNDGNIGSAGALDAMQISSGGIVTFKDDIKIKDGGTIGSATTAGAITIASDGIVTFVDDIKIKDAGTIGSATTPTAMTIASDGIVTFVDDIKIKDAGTIGSATTPTAIGIASDGVVTFVDDIKIKDAGTIGVASKADVITIAADGDTTIDGGLGIAGNTNPFPSALSLGTPANATLRTHAASGAANLIIGDATVTSPYNLDVRGTANVGALTAKTIVLSDDGGVQVPNDGNIGSAGSTAAIQIASDGVVTFADDIKVKDDGTIGSASAATAMTIASDGIVTFVDDIKIKDDGTIGSATTPTAMTIASDGIVTFVDDIKIKDAGTIGSATTPTAIGIASDGIVTFVDDIKIKDAGTIGSATTPAAIGIAANGRVTMDSGVEIDNITIDGTQIALSSGDLTIDSDGAIILDADDGDGVSFHRAGTKWAELIRPSSLGGARLALEQANTDFEIRGQVGGEGTLSGVLHTHFRNHPNYLEVDVKVGNVRLSTDTARIIFGDDVNNTVTLQHKLDKGLYITEGLGLAGNTSPLNNSLSIGQPANVVIRTHDASGKANIIVGDATATSSYNLDVRGTANVGVLTTQGVDPLANDLATYNRLNANLNVVQDNVAAIVGTTLSPATNVVTSVAGANAYGIGAAVSVIARTRVSLSGINQLPTTDYVVPSSGVIQLTDPSASIPAGIPIHINYWS